MAGCGVRRTAGRECGAIRHGQLSGDLGFVVPFLERIFLVFGTSKSSARDVKKHSRRAVNAAIKQVAIILFLGTFAKQTFPRNDRLLSACRASCNSDGDVASRKVGVPRECIRYNRRKTQSPSRHFARSSWDLNRLL